MSTNCCDRMDQDLNQKCNVHPNRNDCPEALIDVVKGGFVLLVHDGGSSGVSIDFCPWCGAQFV